MSEPSWQLDSEAVACTLCHRRFSFFNRRHHCRKCGHVVCNACSAQEIRYFTSTLVVLPIGRSRALPYELYRTCDACVDEIRMIRRALFAEGGGTSSLDDPEHNDLNVVNSPALTLHPLAAQVFAHANSSSSSVLKHATARTRTRLIHLSTHSSFNHDHDHNHDNDNDNDSASTQLDINLCPVCATDLAQIFHGTGVDEFELFKEAHINGCLTQFDFSFDHGRSPTALGNRMHTRNKMLVYNIPPIPPPKFETINGTQSQSFHDFDSGSSGIEQSISDALNDVAATSVGLDLTIPLEKGQAGHECVICLEDLKPGDKVGRLECLCVFHYKCIKDWFNKKGYGECPVHFLHR